MSIQWNDALIDSAEQADAEREAKWQQARAEALSSAVYRQYDAVREANDSASGLVNALGMVVLIGMGIVFLLTALYVCGAPWAGVW